MACLKIPPVFRFSPSALRALRFHYTGGAQCTLVYVPSSSLMPSFRLRRLRAVAPAALLAMVAAGCSSSPSTPSPTPTGAPGGTAAQGGTLTIGVWQAPTTL